MSDNTTDQQLAKLLEQNAKILSNQKSLEGLIFILANHIYTKDDAQFTRFEAMAKSWPVKQ